jgi:hypothetical protein
VPDGAVIAFASLVLKRDDFLVLSLFQNLSRHLCSGDHWVALSHIFSVSKEQHVTERSGLARFDIEKIDIDCVTFRDAKLPATSPDDCVSHSFSGGEKAVQNPIDRRSWQTESAILLEAQICHHFNGSDTAARRPYPSEVGADNPFLLGRRLRGDLIGRADEFSIQRFIALSREVPRKIASHRTFHQLRPKALVTEDVARPFHRVPESVA